MGYKRKEEEDKERKEKKLGDQRNQQGELVY
jgi:hypothetical protein